ncbi:hypothetical protein [Actinopolymorpha pittospori]|uniref:Uncharacterized protein n=1 Tax=Actinopolymorpha pittospori TaxID=648752 RepID=A0A927MWZ1_9ACTN|nr:hypothetical protein [Actinopolymorpha pittospori]MBE1604765.1 hypothetical protein [Actinopolymorpha pittospori]
MHVLFGLLPTYWPAKSYWLAAEAAAYWPYVLGGLAYNTLLAYALLRRLTRTAQPDESSYVARSPTWR